MIVFNKSAGLVVVLTAFCMNHAVAQDRCRVTDPTGSPLNVRAAPNGSVDGTVRNGEMVRIIMTDHDDRGRTWAFIERLRDKQTLGWVYREFISCF